MKWPAMPLINLFSCYDEWSQNGVFQIWKSHKEPNLESMIWFLVQDRWIYKECAGTSSLRINHELSKSKLRFLFVNLDPHFFCNSSDSHMTICTSKFFDFLKVSIISWDWRTSWCRGSSFFFKKNAIISRNKFNKLNFLQIVA